MRIMASCFFIQKIQTKNLFWWNFKFWFNTFKREHLLHQKESILQRTIKKTHNENILMVKKEDKNLLAILKN
jgi:hypothetical protein